MTTDRLTAEDILRRLATELTALAFAVTSGDRDEVARLRRLAELADDARMALCTCPQPWQGSPQPHTILCALVRPVKPLGATS